MYPSLAKWCWRFEGAGAAGRDGKAPNAAGNKGAAPTKARARCYPTSFIEEDYRRMRAPSVLTTLAPGV